MEVLNINQAQKMLNNIRDILAYDDKDEDECIEQANKYIEACKEYIENGKVIMPDINEVDYEDEEEDDNWCQPCSGTGISPSGLVDSSCSSCGGSGCSKV